MPVLTAERLREVLDYNPQTGEFRWKVRTAMCAPVGSKAGGRSGGYLLIGLDREKFKAHRLAWLHHYGVWPKGDLDHLNGDGLDNRIENLRDVPHAVNLQNRRRPNKQSKSQLLGAHFVKTGNRQKRWTSQIRTGDELVRLGYFATAEEASAAYLDAKRRLHQGCTL